MTIGYIAQGLWSATKTTCGAAVSTAFIAAGSAVLNAMVSENSKLLNNWEQKDRPHIFVLGSVAVAAFASLMGKELGKAAIRDGMKWTFVKPIGVKVTELLFVISAVAIGYLLNERSKNSSSYSRSSQRSERQTGNRDNYEPSASSRKVAGQPTAASRTFGNQPRPAQTGTKSDTTLTTLSFDSDE